MNAIAQVEIDQAERAVLEALEYAQARHGDGTMGLAFASRHATEAVAAIALASESEPAQRAARLASDHCEQLEAGQGLPLVHAYGALEAAWSALEHAGGGAGMMGDNPISAGEAQAVSEIQSQLGPALNDPQTLSNVVQAYTGLPSAQANSVIGVGQQLLQGHAPSLASLAPLIAGGLAIAGVGAPIIAVVAAALPLLVDLLNALGIQQGPPSCTFTVGGVCFQQTIPYGPVDPETGQPNLDWNTWGGWVSIHGGIPIGPNASLSGNQVAAAFPWYWMIAQELPVIDDVLAVLEPPALLGGGPSAIPIGTVGIVKGSAMTFSAGKPLAPARPSPPPRQVTTTTNVWLFLRTYYTLWMANAEQAINGHPYASDADLLSTCVASWNAVHGGRDFYMFQPATVGAEQVPPVVDGTDLTNPNFPTFVSMLLSGAMDGHAQPPMRVNLGPVIAPLGAPAPAATGTSSSGVAIAVVAVAGVAAAAYGGVFGQGAEGAVKGLVGGRR